MSHVLYNAVLHGRFLSVQSQYDSLPSTANILITILVIVNKFDRGPKHENCCHFATDTEIERQNYYFFLTSLTQNRGSVI